VKKYLPRIYDDILKFKLQSTGAVCIKGPKWCGKSTTALQLAKSTVFMQDPHNLEQNINLAKANPSFFLKGETPKLIDEWQVIPFIWDSIRFEVDKRDKFNQFILTGSATPPDSNKIMHSGAGRITYLMMRTMSLFESNDSTGEVSIKQLFSNPDIIEGKTNKTLEDIFFLICRGGWPKAINQKPEIALAQSKNFYDMLVHSDMSKVDNVKRSEERIISLMRSLSRNIGTTISLNEIKRDMIQNDEPESLSTDTVASYIEALKKLFIVENLNAWNPNLRSASAIRTKPTRYFVDPSIATAALDIGPIDLMNDLKTAGFLFEAMCIRDLRIYAESLNGRLYHFRDNKGFEIDSIIHLDNGNYGLIEIKLFDQNRIDQGANNLLKLSSRINTKRMKKPSFLMVLTGTNYAYKRDDGVFVVPITCLKN
jgi:predicted AAA+ superfamily ATPase